VVDPHPPRRPRRWPARLELRERLHRMVDESGPMGLASATLPVRLGVAPSLLPGLIADMASDLVELDGSLWLRSSLEGLMAEVPRLVDRYHAAYPLEEGLPVNQLRRELAFPDPMVDGALAAEVARATVEVHGAAIRRPGWRPVLSAEELATAERLRRLLDEAAWEPPSVTELAGQIGSDVARLLRFMERDGSVIQVEETRYYASSQLRSLIHKLRSVVSPGEVLQVGEVKEALGLSRKYLIPFLEYCDRRGLTQRRGEGRVWLGAATDPR
jgi:selenocysteine-specific elongation factor